MNKDYSETSNEYTQYQKLFAEGYRDAKMGLYAKKRGIIAYMEGYKIFHPSDFPELKRNYKYTNNGDKTSRNTYKNYQK